MPLHQIVRQADGRKGLSDEISLCPCPMWILDEAQAIIDRAEAAAKEAEDNFAGDIVISDPEFSLPKEVSNLNATTAFTVTARGYVADIANYYLSVSALNLTDVSFSDGNLSFTVSPDIAAGTVLEVSVYAKDTLGNKSATVTHQTIVGTATVGAPQVISPEMGAEVDGAAGSITVMASEFTTSGSFTDTHKSSQFQLLRNGEVIADKTATGTSYTFTDLELTNGETLSARVRYEGTNVGWGPWSGEVSFTIKSGIVTPTGEKLALNPTGDGVRVWYVDPYDNVQKVMDVALAAQRTAEIWTLASVAIPGLVSISTGNYDPNTAAHNTQAIVDYFEENLSGTCAAYTASVMEIGGVFCNLPNKQQLEIIYRVRDVVDNLDTTVASNPTKALSNWGFASSANAACWSSSQFNAINAWEVNWDGSYGAFPKNRAFGVIPILELDPVTMQPI